MDITLLVNEFPRLYHMAEPGAWPSIKRHGLLSTTALLDLFEISGNQRRQLERQHRPESVLLTHAAHGTAVVRDQKPMSDSALHKCLQDALTAEDWYLTLNAKVFFWLSRERLTRLLTARAYRDRRQTVLELDSQALITDYRSKILLSPINSGSTIMNPQPRGLKTFLTIEEYPYDLWRKKRRRSDAVVELAVIGGVPNISEYVLKVTEEGGSQSAALLYEP